MFTENLQLAPFHVDAFDQPLLVLERTVADLDLVADVESHLGQDLLLALAHLAEHRIDLARADRLGIIAVGKTDHAVVSRTKYQVFSTSFFSSSRKNMLM